MNDSLWMKALWIADGLGKNPEDVYDVLLGNISRPQELVYDVQRSSDEYDRRKERGLREDSVHQERTDEGPTISESSKD